MPAARDDPHMRRVKAMQRRLGVDDDGVIGSDTLTRIETLLERVERDAPHLLSRRDDAPAPAEAQPLTSMTVSRRGIDELVAFEITSEAVYARRYQRPVWPGGHSGVTIGIGYDVGMMSEAQLRADWTGRIADAMVERLTRAVHLTGAAARPLATRLHDVVVPFPVANAVFSQRTLPRYARATRSVWPGVEHLPADAQAMLLSLVYNRGTSLAGERRREMAAIRPLIAAGDLAGIAAELRAMQRLWDPDQLPGLIARREREAELVENADRVYDPAELIRV